MPFILHIDDDAALSRVMAEALESLGYRTDRALTFADGLARAREKKPDLILLDVMMPSVDGYTGCAQLKSDPVLKDVPVILLTALDKLEHVERAFKAGACDFISKPVGLAKLKAKLAKHLPVGPPGA